MLRKALFATMIFALTALAAQPHRKKAGAAPSLAGSWQFTLMPAASTTPSSPIPGLATFTTDGSVVETDGAELSPVSASTAPNTAASPGHGIWQPAPAAGTLYVRYVSLVVNGAGLLLGANVTTMPDLAVLSATTGSTFAGSYTTQFIDPAGVAGRTTTGTVKGELIAHPKLP